VRQQKDAAAKQQARKNKTLAKKEKEAGRKKNYRETLQTDRQLNELELHNRRVIESVGRKICGRAY
jgi:hypothetical protein